MDAGSIVVDIFARYLNVVEYYIRDAWQYKEVCLCYYSHLFFTTIFFSSQNVLSRRLQKLHRRYVTSIRNISHPTIFLA